jgi:predicted nicotinamide N-methyase
MEKIGRLRFRRGIPNRIPLGSKVDFQLFITGEIDNIEVVSTQVWSKIRLEVGDCRRLDYWIPISIKGAISAAGNFLSISFRAADLGKYNLRISFPSEIVSNMTILTLISDKFEVYAIENGVKLPNEVLFRNYRAFFYESFDSSLLIEEEYGLTIGSHVYDSSIVLNHYLEQSSPEQSFEQIIELGAGCGLSGIFAAYAFNASAILTDCRNQLPLLKKNVKYNDPFHRCVVMEFDWCIEEHLIDLMQHIDVSKRTLLLAADVLYHSTATSAMFYALSELSKAFPSSFLVVAQKNRRQLEVQDAMEYLQSLDNGIKNVGLLHNESEVFVWEVQLH